MKELYFQCNFKEAIDFGLNIIEMTVKEIHKFKTGKELITFDLMMHAFSQDGSICLNQYLSQNDKNIQDGYKYIFAGIMKGIRGPFSHNNFVVDENTAIHYLFIISHALNIIENRIK